MELQVAFYNHKLAKGISIPTGRIRKKINKRKEERKKITEIPSVGYELK